MAGYLAGDVDKWIYIDIADQHSEKKLRYLDLRNMDVWKNVSERSEDSAAQATDLPHARTG